MEFVIGNTIRVHPMALVHFDQVSDEGDREAIEELTKGYARRTDYFVDRLARGLGRIAATVYPYPAIVRMSDLKTNEYANLIGGAAFEPKEENPMLGFRGASRYYSQAYHEAFALECMAIVKLRNEMGFSNVRVMVPFCRTVEEADRVLVVMGAAGLRRGDGDLEIHMMCETPADVILAADFARRFDGFSVGSNDLTQLTLGVDRDSEALAELFDEENPAVRWIITAVTSEAHKVGVKVGFCGEAPGDIPGYVNFLVGADVDSISVSPDQFIDVKHQIAKAETGRVILRLIGPARHFGLVRGSVAIR